MKGGLILEIRKCLNEISGLKTVVLIRRWSCHWGGL